MTRIGLVLGAGGITGGAFHAGVLAALAEHTGWDPRRAEVIVGTSAGSATAAALRAGLPAGDLAARAQGLPLSPEGLRLVSPAFAQYGAAGVVPPRPSSLPTGGPAAPGVLGRAARRPGRVRLGAVFAGLMPEGTASTAMITDGIGSLFPSGWPGSDLWICAVRLEDGRLVVFGRPGAPATTVGLAVAGSCAIPGYFKPVRIDGSRYVDGGAHSFTNVGEVAGLGLDLVIVSAPMSRTGGAGGTPSMVRGAGRVQLDLESARVRRRGTPVVVFQPTPADEATMGLNAMDPSRRLDVVVQARESALRRLDRPDVARRLEALRS